MGYVYIQITFYDTTPLRGILSRALESPFLPHFKPLYSFSLYHLITRTLDSESILDAIVELHLVSFCLLRIGYLGATGWSVSFFFASQTLLVSLDSRAPQKLVRL